MRVSKWSALVMSIRQYFKPRGSVPNPSGPLPKSVAPDTITIANKSVGKDYSNLKQGRIQDYGKGGAQGDVIN